MKERVAILGASNQPARYACMAGALLQEHGYQVVPVNPNKAHILGQDCLHSLEETDEPVDTVTVYINSTRFQGHLDAILKAKPRRIIFNPGAECPETYGLLEDKGIEVIEACTLVLLHTGQY
jgi:predicted CoA-binding protein